MSPRASAGILSLSALVSLAAFLFSFTARFPWFSGGYGVTVWWYLTDDPLLWASSVTTIWASWIVPLVALTVAKRGLEGNGWAWKLVARIEETRQWYAYSSVAFVVFLFLFWFGPLWPSGLLLVPVFYVAFPAIAYSNLLRRGKRPEFAALMQPVRSGSGAGVRLLLGLRFAALTQAFIAMGLWIVIEKQAPWWLPGSPLQTLEALAAGLGTSGFVMIVVMLLIQAVPLVTPPRTREPDESLAPHHNQQVR